MDKVSFVVPVYNVENYIGRCIESLISQKYENIEIILVDDGSTDNSYRICCTYQTKDSRIKVLRQKNSGANNARNKGLDYATGKWICFVDGDDWISDELCSELSVEMSHNWDIIIFSYNKIRNHKIQALNSCEQYHTFCKKDFRELQLVTLNRFRNSECNYKMLDTVSVWNKLYNRDFLLVNNLKFVPGMPKLQDLTFNLNVYEYASNAVYVHKHLYNYRINRESVSHRYQPDIISKFNIINDYIYNFIQAKDDEEYKSAYFERIITHLRTIIVLDLCNEKNEKTYKDRKREFFQILRSEPYKTALKQAKINNLPLKESILALGIKYQCFIVCSILCMGLKLLNLIQEKI